jgi:hypothetical protein
MPLRRTDACECLRRPARPLRRRRSRSAQPAAHVEPDGCRPGAGNLTGVGEARRRDGRDQFIPAPWVAASLDAYIRAGHLFDRDNPFGQVGL